MNPTLIEKQFKTETIKDDELADKINDLFERCINLVENQNE